MLVYTVWLKRRTWLNIVVGGLAGSFAVLAGAAAVKITPETPVWMAGYGARTAEGTAHGDRGFACWFAPDPVPLMAATPDETVVAAHVNECVPASSVPSNTRATSLPKTS